MSGGPIDFRDKAVVDGLDRLEDFLDMLESLGCRDVAVERVDERSCIVTWVSPSPSIADRSSAV